MSILSGAQVEVAKQCDIKAKQITSYILYIAKFWWCQTTEFNSIEIWRVKLW